MFITGSAWAALGQTGPVASPSFAAASVKLNRTGENGNQTMTPGRIVFTSVSLKECLMAAYELRSYQVDGPSSLGSDRYDIVAAAEGPASRAELRAMLKTLLADRFGLRIHIETRELRSYRLVTTKKGPKLTRAATDQPGGYTPDGGAVAFHSTSMSAFADYMSRRAPVDRPVIDGSGIEGLYAIRSLTAKRNFRLQPR